MAASFHDSDVIPHFAKNGNALTKEERASIARRKGLCVQCGRKTHTIPTISVFKRTPLTNENVHKGICIKCNPTSVPVKVLQDYEHRNPRKAPVARVVPRTKPKPALPAMRQGIRRQGIRNIFADQPLTTSGQGAASDNDVIEAKGAELPEVNGLYVRDKDFRGSYRRYTKNGHAHGYGYYDRSFEFYRSAKRWYLSVVPSNGQRQNLYTAWANDQSMESPPTDLWRKLEYGKANAESSLTLSVPAREEEDEDDQREEQAAQAIQIQIVVTTGRSFYLSINTANTITELKEAIQNLDGIPIAHQVLTLKTTQRPIMEDENSLQHYNISGDTAVQLYYPPGYPCRRLFISFLGEKHKLEVDPLDAIQTVKKKIQQSSWFVVYESSDNPLDLVLKLDGEDLDGNLQLAEADVPNQSELQLEVLQDPSNPPSESGQSIDQAESGDAEEQDTPTPAVVHSPTEKELATEWRLRIVTPTEKSFFLVVGVSDTVGELKQTIQRLRGIPFVHQQLKLAESETTEPFENKKTLQTYGVNGDATLELQYPPEYPCRQLLISFFGNNYKLEVNPSDTVKSVKEMIKASPWFLDYSYDSQLEHNLTDFILSFGWDRLKDNQQLAEAEIPHQATIQFDAKRKQGMSLDRRGLQRDNAPPEDAKEQKDMTTEEQDKATEETGGAIQEEAQTQTNMAQTTMRESPTEENETYHMDQQVTVKQHQEAAHERDEAVHETRVSSTETKEELDENGKLFESHGHNQTAEEGENELEAAFIALDESHLLADDAEEDSDIPTAVAVAVAETTEEGSGSLHVEPATTSVLDTKGRDPRTRSRGSPNRSTDVTTSVPVSIPAPTGKLAGPGLGTDMHQMSGDSQAVSLQPVAGPDHSQSFNPNINSTLPADNAAGVGAGGQGRNPSGSTDGQVPLGIDSATVQKWAGLLDQLGGQIDPDRKISQYTPLPSQYMQDEAARKYHRAFEDSMYAAVTVMQMHSQGMGLPGPTILGRLVRAPIQAAGFLVSTVGEMIISIFEWQHERACVVKAKKFLEALPASNGVALERFVTRLSCTMVHTHMQRSSNNGIDQAMTKIESQVTKTGNNISAGTMDGLSAAFTRWREAAKKKGGGSVAVDADSFNSYTAAAVVHVGLVTRALVDHSDALDSIKGGGSSPEDMVCKLMEALEIPSGAPTTIADAKSNPTVLVAGAIDATPASTTIANQASFDPKKLLEDFEEMKQRVHGVEEMKEKFERLEQREKQLPKDDNARNRVRQTTTQMQVLEAGVGEASSSFSSSNAWAQGAVAETDANRATLFGVNAHGQVDAERSELSGEHNDRISQLEAQLAATQDHVAALLEVVALTMDTDSSKKGKQEKERKRKQGKERKRRIDLARRIIQGDSRSEEEEVAEYGYKQGEGLFADDRIMEEEGSGCDSDSSSGHSDGANGEPRPLHADS